MFVVGMIIVIVGLFGVGKSMLLMLFVCFMDLDCGMVWFGGVDL